MNLLIVAGGLGTRTAKFTIGNYFPKIFMSLGNETILDKLISNTLAQHASKIYLMVSSEEHVQMIESYLSVKGCHNVGIVTCDSNNSIFYNIQQFITNFHIETPLVLHWSDVFSDEKGYEKIFGKVSESKRDLIVTDTNRRHRFAYSEKFGITMSPNATGNIPGIYFIKNPSDIASTEPDKYKDIVEYLAEVNKTLPLHSIDVDIEDIGDESKYNEYLSTHQSTCRYFNSIEVDDEYVTKRAVTPYGKEVLANEIQFYSHHKDKQGKVIPIVYTASSSAGCIKMQKIDGMTVNECVEKFDKLHINARIPRKLLSSYMAMHRVFSPLRTAIQINEDIHHEYIETMIGRVESIKPFLPANDTKFYIDGVLVECSQNSLDELLPQITIYLNSIQYLLGDVHGDTNTSNVMISTPSYERGNLMFNDMWMIDPRGKFGKSKYKGDINYDIAKFLYGLSGYSNFTIDNNFRINKNELGLVFEMSKYGYDIDFLLTDVMLNADTELVKKYKMLIGIIYVKLSAYTINNIHKVIAAYVQGIKLIREALAM